MSVASMREMKRVLAGMRAKIDQVFTAAEKRKLLKDIATGLIGSADELRAYVGRVEMVKRKKEKEQTAQLTGKIVDASSRQPLAGVDVTIQRTNYKEKTDTGGNFIWGGLVKGRAITIQSTFGGYKPNQTQYQATTDNEQNVVVKMVPLGTSGPGKDDPAKKKSR